MLRIRFCLDDSEGIVLQKMFKAGAEPYSEVQTSVAAKQTAHRCVSEIHQMKDPRVCANVRRRGIGMGRPAVCVGLWDIGYVPHVYFGTPCFYPRFQF